MKRITEEQLINRITMNRFEDDVTEAPGYYKITVLGKDQIGINTWYIYRQYKPLWTEAAIAGGYEPVREPGIYDGIKMAYEDLVSSDISWFLQSDIDNIDTHKITEAAIAGGIEEKLDKYFASLGQSEATDDLARNGYL